MRKNQKIITGSSSARIYFSPIKERIVGIEYTRTRNAFVPSSPHSFQSDTILAYCVSCIILSRMFVNWFTKTMAINAATKKMTERIFQFFPCAIITIGISKRADWCIVAANKIIIKVGIHFFFSIKPVAANRRVTAVNCLIPLNIQDR